MRALVFVIVAGCGSSATHPVEKPADNEGDVRLAAAVDSFMGPYLAFRPNAAIDLGLHEYDGKVPDRSPAAITAEIARLHQAHETFEAIAPSTLSKRGQAERALVATEIDKELFQLETRRLPFRDPFYYLFRFSLNAYLARDYADETTRARGMLAACKAAPAYYQQAAQNLEPNLPKQWLGAALLVSGGTLEFLNTSAEHAFTKDAALHAELAECLHALAGEVQKLRDGLQARMATATDNFRLGADNLVAMLKATEGLSIDIPTLQRMAQDDLARNHAALVAAAKQVDPNKDVAAVLADVIADKPEPAAVIDEANKQLVELRAFIVDKQIISLPLPDEVKATTSPPFMRGNFAAFSGVGPFEKRPLPSFYYIAPPDPAWPPEQQKAYVMSRPELLFTSAHEVYPGHFVTGMHERASHSRVLATFETYTSSEGWAHYVEEMMWEQGLGAGDPKAHIGMLKSALLRDVRMLVALGYHAGNMTVEDATKLFVTEAFADPKTAMQQAMRGTVDPMFLGYTLGKLEIMELRADWQKAHPGAPIRQFHDEFLSYGEAPLSTVRHLMVGDALRFNGKLQASEGGAGK